ncbi:MAG: hypothetical protein KF902_01490 [Phycisphaeraceae bacterium]|nr:hypothetical protein [Phycisphaeraceae bacterium]MCW5767863.1 hypothetical protein [Phycisphaeraceae bacterium]QYK48121.1 MAG: hypothetical protein KF838_15180 [Phycisphaeraceae bacterium]
MKKTTALFLVAGLATIASAQDPTLDQSRAELANMKADAANRTSLLAAGADAGHDGKGFYMADGDNFRLNVGGQVQFRYNMNFRDRDSAPDQNDEFTHGFQTRRTKLEFTGNVLNPNLHFMVVGAFNAGDKTTEVGEESFSSGGGNFVLEDAWVAYDFNENLTMSWGQFKVPFNREEMVSSKYQLAADRSTMNETFNADRTQGLALEWHNDNFRIIGAFTDGYRAANSDFTSSAEADYALTARIEYNTVGSWSRFKDFTSWRSAENVGLLFGGAVHWQDGGETGGTIDSELFGLTADVSVEGKGWNLFGAVIWTNTEPASSSDRDDWGFVVQGGVFVTNKDELFARWDMLFPDSDAAGDDDFTTLTFGWNHYFVEESHAAKLTVDVLWYLDRTDETDIVSPSTGYNLLPSSDDDQWGIRAQFQLLF